MSDPRELQAVKKQSNFSGGFDVDLDPLTRGRRHQREKSVDARCAAISRRLPVESMNQPRLKIAGIAKVDQGELFAALVQGIELELLGGVVEPGHSLCRSAPGADGHNHLESAEVATGIAFLSAMIEPENAESENAIDSR